MPGGRLLPGGAPQQAEVRWFCTSGPAFDANCLLLQWLRRRPRVDVFLVQTLRAHGVAEAPTLAMTGDIRRGQRDGTTCAVSWRPDTKRATEPVGSRRPRLCARMLRHAVYRIFFANLSFSGLKWTARAPAHCRTPRRRTRKSIQLVERHVDLAPVVIARQDGRPLPVPPGHRHRDLAAVALRPPGSRLRRRLSHRLPVAIRPFAAQPTGCALCAGSIQCR